MAGYSPAERVEAVLVVLGKIQQLPEGERALVVAVVLGEQLLELLGNEPAAKQPLATGVPTSLRSRISIEPSKTKKMQTKAADARREE
jgi:hypothetical protein